MSQFTEFLLLSPSLAGYSLNSYVDVDGNLQYVSDRKDENGNPIKRRFKFSYNNRVIRVPNAQKNIIKFLRESPECEGSPNAYKNPATGEVLQKFYYKEVNTEKDAEAVVENETMRIEAQMKALSLKGQDLTDAAVMCGTYDIRESFQKKRVLDYAGSNPKGFVEMISSPDFKVRSWVRAAVEKNIINKKGFMYKIADLHIGNDEDSAVQFLMKDKKILETVKDKLGVK